MQVKEHFTRRWTQQHGKSFSGLRGKLFGLTNSTGLCHSKTLTARKRWTICIPVPEFLLVNSVARRLLAAGLYFFADVLFDHIWKCRFSRESRCFPRWSDEVNLIIGGNKMTTVAAQWVEVLASDEGRNTKWLELHIYDIQLQLKLTMRFLIGKYTNRLMHLKLESKEPLKFENK